MNKEQIISFGKVDLFNTGRRINAVEVEVEIRDWNGEDEFTICASIWNIHHTDCVQCGQCLDDIKDYTSVGKNKKFLKLYDLWTKYHLHFTSKIPAEDRKLIYDIIERGIEAL